MRKILSFVILALVFSFLPLPDLLAVTKPAKPKIDIKKITLEAEAKGVVPSGIPLMVLVEVNASEDMAGPFAVDLELKRGKEKQSFQQGIEKLVKGSNAFKWDLSGNPEEGPYSVSVEISSQEPKLKDKSTKSFRVGEKKKPGKTAAKPSKHSATKAEADTVTTQTAESKPAKSKTAKSKTKTTKSGGTKSEGEETPGAKDDAKDNAKDDAKEEDEDDKPTHDFGFAGGEEADHDTTDITVTGSSVKQLTIAGITFNGKFVKQPNGDYLAQGEIKPTGFKISLGKAVGELRVNKERTRIDGQMYISVPVYGKMIQITDLILDKNIPQIKFRGKFEQKVEIPWVHADVQVAEGLADFDISPTRFGCKANGGFIINVAVPKVGSVKFEVVSGEGGFHTAIPPEGVTVTGTCTVTIPFEPPIKVALSGSAEVTKQSVSGTGSATLFKFLEVGNGTFKIEKSGMMTVDANAGAFLKDYGLEANVADMTLIIDLPKELLTADLKQSLKILDLITIPGGVKGKLTVDKKAKLFSISGNAKVPLTPTIVGPDQISAGIQNFKIEVKNYDDPGTRNTELNGELALLVWTLGGFKGTITGSVLDGAGKFNLPPGLKQLLDLESINLPVKIDLRSASIIGDLGGDVGKLFIKHFPLVGPEILVKNDGVHLKGQIGIANVITVPLGDLVFTQNNSYTTIDGDIGIGPFTLAEGNFTLPSKANEGIGFSGKMGIPGLSDQRISGTVYKDGKVDLSGMTKIGLIKVEALTKFDVSKTGLHADTAAFSVEIGKAAKCSLGFSSLDINRSAISGIATATFTGILGVEVPLKGGFSFDGETIVLTYLDAVSLCGISVDKVTLRINKDGVTGSGTISAAGQSKNISITVENGIMKLKGPAGELIAEGMRVVDKLYGTASNIASEEARVVGEDADKTLDNLSRMTDPWVKHVVTAAQAVKGVYNAIEKIVVDEVTEQVKAALEDLKELVDAAVLFAKKAIAAAVDAVCDGIVALVDGVKAIFSEIESLIPAGSLDTYRAIKGRVIEKANAVRAKVVTFRDETKASLYDLTGTITAIYQTAIDTVTAEANKIAAGIKKELDPVISEVDVLLTEIGQEIDQATSAVGDEAERHYNIAKQKAETLKKKSGDTVSKYQDKIGDLIGPYAKPILEKIASEQAKVIKVRDEVLAAGIEGLKAAKETLKPVIEPFENAVKELKVLVDGIGGEVYRRFLNGIGKAGDAMNGALGTAGKGLVKMSDVVGDAAVAVSGAAANVSEAVHDAAAATINFVQDTGSYAVDVAVDTAQEGYQTATQAANQAAAQASQVASQAYQAATQVTAAAQRQVTSTVSTVINNLPPVSPSSFATGTPVSFSDIQSGAQTISAKVSGILNALDGYATGAYNTASGAASSVGSAISGGASSVASGVSSRWKSATRSVSSFFGSSNPQPAPKVDYTAPAITNIAATSTTNSITVTWNTSFNSRTIMFYGATPNLSFSGQDANTAVVSIHTGDNYPETTSHSMTVTGLNPGTAYYYIVYAVSGMAGGGNSTDAGKKGPYLIVTQPSTAIIGGVVKDVAGSAIPGAKIFIGSGTTPAATTDATGRYTLEVNPGSQTLTVKKDNYISSSVTTASLTAGQILPLDFTLTDGRIFVSGTVKDANLNTGIASATVVLTGLPTAVSVPTDANGAFNIMLGTTSSASVQFTMSVTKADYTTYTSSRISLVPGAKMQNIEIKLPHVPPAVNSEDVDVGGVTATQATVFFTTTSNCSAFVQLGLQSAAGYAYQTPVKTNRNSFYFDLVGLTPATAYKYKAVLQDSFGNTVVAMEDTFTTASAVSASTAIGLNATVSNITGNSAKLNIASAFKTLKYQLVLRDTTTNTQVSNQDLGFLVSPVSIDLNNLTDGHSYSVDLTSSLLANVTTGNVLKTETKSVNFQTPALKSIAIREFKVDPDFVKRGTVTTVNVSATVRINHAVTGAVLKVLAGAMEMCSQGMGNLSPGEARVTVPLAVSDIPGTGNVAIQLKIQAGNIQEVSTSDIEIAGPGAQGGGTPPPKQGKTGRPTAV